MHLLIELWSTHVIEYTRQVIARNCRFVRRVIRWDINRTSNTENQRCSGLFDGGCSNISWPQRFLLSLLLLLFIESNLTTSRHSRHSHRLGSEVGILISW